MESDEAGERKIPDSHFPSSGGHNSTFDNDKRPQSTFEDGSHAESMDGFDLEYDLGEELQKSSAS